MGVVGLGYWGPNVARNLNVIEGCTLSWCCEFDSARRQRWGEVFPDARFTGDLDDLLSDESLDAVAITAPVSDHARMAAEVLDAGKHCFVEKPLAHSLDEAASLVTKSEELGLTLMVGHLLEYHPALEALEAKLHSGELGDVVYLYSNRLSLGKLREDENALWDLGTHDLSLMLRLLSEMPDEVWAHGHRGIRDAVEDVVFAHLRFPSGPSAHMHMSWLDPHKERRLTVVGTRRMAVFDDMSIEGKLTIYDKGFDPDEASIGDYVARTGAVTKPPISAKEPLRIEMEHWIDCIAQGRGPRSDGHSALRVIRVLEALQSSLEAGGQGRPVAGDPFAVGQTVG